MAKMMRITDQTSVLLNQLAKKTKKTKQLLIERAIQAYAQELFLRATNKEYERATRSVKVSLEKELDVWDITLEDGLDNEA